MKILLLITLLLLSLTGYSQQPATYLHVYGILKADSIKIENHFKINEKSITDNAAAILIEKNNYSFLKPTSYITVNTAKELDIKMAQITSEILAKVPPSQPTDLTNILNRLSAVETKNESQQQEIVYLRQKVDSFSIAHKKNDGEIQTLFANYATLNDRINNLPIQTGMIDSFAANRKLVFDSFAVHKKRVDDTVTAVKKRADGTNSAVYINNLNIRKDLNKRIDSVIVHGTDGANILMQRNQDLGKEWQAEGYYNIKLWADKIKQIKN